MLDTHLIVREPLLNTQERVLGYELAWQQVAAADRAATEDEAFHLVRFAAEYLAAPEAVSLLGEQLVFLEVTPGVLGHPALDLLPARGTVLVLRAAGAGNEEVISGIAAARKRGFAISIREPESVQLDERLAGSVDYLEVRMSAPEFASQVQQHQAQSRVQLIARGVNSWKARDLSASLSMFAFVGQLHLTPRPGSQARELNPAQTLVLQLMDMVRKNADVKQLENVLKRDPALSYKLLRYINSAGFGLGCEIQSLRHAVTMLGYSPLYRWLALLLATATTTGYSPVLMQTAVIRGRFAELLGAGFLPKHEAENLFVTGMFSLLDRLLGVPMEQTLEKIQLSDAVTRALLARDGIYGPFLALAEACESTTADVEGMASSLCIDIKQVNQAQVAALAWAQTLQL